LNPYGVTKRIKNGSLFFMFYIYILYSSILERYYIGFTAGNIEDRLKKHLAKHKGYTSVVKDWEVVYYETFATKREAMERERKIKSWKSKMKIEELIKGSNE
jgi:putative endonuclease